MAERQFPAGAPDMFNVAVTVRNSAPMWDIGQRTALCENAL